jgi:hypothetical protein
VRTFITDAFRSGRVPSSALASLGNSLNQLDSINSIDNLDPALFQVVSDAFREGVRWAFISLIPWFGVSFLLSLKLSAIQPNSEEVSSTAPQGVQSEIQTHTNDVETGANIPSSQAYPPRRRRGFGLIAGILTLVDIIKERRRS